MDIALWKNLQSIYCIVSIIINIIYYNIVYKLHWACDSADHWLSLLWFWKVIINCRMHAHLVSYCVMENIDININFGMKFVILVGGIWMIPDVWNPSGWCESVRWTLNAWDLMGLGLLVQKWKNNWYRKE